MTWWIYSRAEADAWAYCSELLHPDGSIIAPLIFLTCFPLLLARSLARSLSLLSLSLSLCFSRYLVGCRRTSSHFRRPNGVGGRVCQEADVQRAMVASLSTLRFLFVAVDVTGSPSPPLTPPRDDGRQDADAELSPSDSASHNPRQDVC